MREAGERAVRHEREIREIADKHERQLRRQGEKAVEQARRIQFKEYARRLTDLNHAHELERQRNAESVTRVEFTLFKDDLEKRTVTADRELRSKLDLLGAGAVREDATRALQADQQVNRRWLIGLVVAVGIAVTVDVLTVVLFLLRTG